MHPEPGLPLTPKITCPKCRGSMRIINFIQDQEVIKTFLTFLGLWFVPPASRQDSDPQATPPWHAAGGVPPSAEGPRAPVTL